MRSNGAFARALAVLLVGISAPASIFAVSNSNASPGYWLIFIPGGILVTAILAGYYEPFGKRVWIYASLLTLPELVAFPIAILTYSTMNSTQPPWTRRSWSSGSAIF